MPLCRWGHSATLPKLNKRVLDDFMGLCFFRRLSPQTEGRRDADHKIKTWPDRVCAYLGEQRDTTRHETAVPGAIHRPPGRRNKPLLPSNRASNMAWTYMGPLLAPGDCRARAHSRMACTVVEHQTRGFEHEYCNQQIEPATATMAPARGHLPWRCSFTLASFPLCALSAVRYSRHACPQS